MQVSVCGGQKKQRELVESIAHFCADKLMSSRLHDKIDLNIKLSRSLMSKENIYGDVIWEDDDYRPKEFTMRVDTTPRMRLVLETVAHEMVHVKQYARNELKQLMAFNKHRFNGQYFDDNVNYWDRPWEIEAHGREVGLFVRWAEAEGLGHLEWTHDYK